MRLLIHFARYGPYHHARLRAAHEVLSPLGWEVYGLETAGTDATYDWDETKGDADGPRVITAFPHRVYEEITAAEYRSTLFPLLEAIQPTHMAIAGWGSTDALMCLSWCRKNDVRRIVMSETREVDGKRVWWKELIKRYLISRFDGALVGGKSHRDYLVKLGMKSERIAFGYNVVDNAYFREACLKVQKSKVEGQEEPPYFLASNRFIERKNLSRLIEAYASCIQKSSIINHQSSIWPLVLLGDGELKADLIAKCHELGLQVIESAPWDDCQTTQEDLVGCPLSVVREGLQSEPRSLQAPRDCAARDVTVAPNCDPQTTDNRQPTTDSPASHSHLTPLGTSGPARRASPTVYFPGFRQIEELPRFYAHAGCFIHPALEEPWGLVINEAMACGLPVLSSNNVGAAEELIDDGVNGWKFDPVNVEQIAELMGRISDADFPLSTFSSASRRMLEEHCPTQAFGKGLAELFQR